MTEGSNPETRERQPIRWLHVVLTGFALLWVILAVWTWTWNFKTPNVTDFISYWAAGKLTLAGDPAAAWDVARHRAMESTTVKITGMMPFPYPPPFLLAVTPFAVLPYVVSLIAWVIVTGAIFAYATRRIIEPAYAFAHPSVLINGWIGQNGFLTAAIFASGTALLATQPFLAGAILGTLVIKPQIALLLPIAVIASREWRAIAGAALSMTVLLLVALIAFGPASYEGFFRILPLYTELMRQDKWPWNEFISPFAFVRWFGVDRTVALGIQAAIALAAGAVTWIAWSRRWDSRVPVLAAATLLVPPYLLTYDALLLIVPIGYWISKRRIWPTVAVWFLCSLPVVFYFGLYRGPNTVPIATIVSLFVLVAGERSAHVDHANAV